MNGKVVVEEEGEEDDNNGIEMFPGEQIIVECCDGKELEIPLEIALMSPKVVDMIKNNEYVEEETTSPYLFPPVPEKYKKIVLKDVPSFGLSGYWNIVNIMKIVKKKVLGKGIFGMQIF